jgi:hypothetical protein
MLQRRTLLSTLLWLPLGAWAQDGPLVVEGQPFDRLARVGGADLRLNGTGVRAVAWFKGYAAGLYLGARAANAGAVLANAGPKRLQIRMLQDVPAAEFVKAFRKGMTRNTPEAELAQLAPRMDRFAGAISAVGKVRKGDVVDLDFEPGRGTAFSLNGKLRADVIAGDDFYAALLRSFIGDHPYDDKLRAGLLGQAG